MCPSFPTLCPHVSPTLTPRADHVILADGRSVKPWWRKKAADIGESQARESSQRKRLCWAPGMKFDEQGFGVSLSVSFIILLVNSFVHLSSLVQLYSLSHCSKLE